ncbi:MAG: G8 domain-containing protein [Sulfitobacter sp.]
MALVAFCTPARPAAADPPSDASLGIGLAVISDWGTQHPFIDVMKTARPWVGHLPSEWGAWTHDNLARGGYLDAHGWPTSLPVGLTAIETLVLVAQPEGAQSLAGRYRVRYEGTGTLGLQHSATNVEHDTDAREIWFDYAPGNDGLVGIAIEATDPADPIRNISVVHEDNLALHDQGKLFNPHWLARLEGMQVLRFMDWMQTNDSKLKKWDDRPQVADVTYALRGAPVEVMVALANETGIDPWFTMPHLANDDFNRKFAAYVKDALDPDRKAYVEYSNEVWNPQFEQAQWAIRRGAALWGKRVYDAHAQFAGGQAAGMAQIWGAVFAQDPDRLVRIISTQTGWEGLEQGLLLAPRWMDEDRSRDKPPFEYFEAYGVTGYFSGQLGAEKADTVRQWVVESQAMAAADADAQGLTGQARSAYLETHKFDFAVTQAAKELRDGSVTGVDEDTVEANITRSFPYHAEVARSFGLDLIMYEGGTHVVGVGAPVDDDLLTEFFSHFNYSPEMGALYDRMLQGWADVGGTVFTAYVDVIAPSKWGSWGALRHLDDDNPRWDALMRFKRAAAGQDPVPEPEPQIQKTSHDHGHTAPKASAGPAEGFVADVMARDEPHAHGDDAGKATEHMALLKLVPRADATHVAISNGGWFDPATWHQGHIPGDGAQALIPDGISVTYDGISDASLFTLRVDGALSFATDADTRLEIDTMIVSPSGRLEIGTEDTPLQADVTARIVIANNGDIDTDWDPTLVSRGVISHGTVKIHGTEKASHIATAVAPMRRDRQITLAETPTGWQVGDTLVVTGTHKQGWTWDNNLLKTVYRKSQDEEVKITAIDGNVLTLDRLLVFSHDTPRDDLHAYVANLSRNVTVSSADGADTATHHRGHVMFMHSAHVDVRYAAFDDLGRTDKSTPAFDVAALGAVHPDSNIKSRYPFHFHKTGTQDQATPAIAIGNAISRSPGWGYVHHASHADFIRNVAFDVFGAAFAAEDGDETGIWAQNIAIRAQGTSFGEPAVKLAEDLPRHDNGRTGDGFFFAGRLVEASNNIAANTTHGYVWMTRSAPKGPYAANLEHPEVAYGKATVRPNIVPIKGFRDNEAFGTQVGMIVVKANPAQNHDLRTVMEGFTNWETSEGVSMSYTSHYTLIDFDLTGTKNTDPIASAGAGVVVGTNMFDFVMNRTRIGGFETGVALNQSFTFPNRDSDVDNLFIDVEMADVQTPYTGLNPAWHRILSSDQLIKGQLGFDMTGDSTLSIDEDLYLTGTKTDSIGTRPRQFDGDPQHLTFIDNIVPLIVNQGYYRTPDGRNVLLLDDFVADRATGDLRKLRHVITLDMSEDEIKTLWAVQQLGSARFNGVYNPEG